MPPEPPVSRRLSRRLSSEQLEEIRAKYRAGASTHELRTEFDLAQGSVLKILNGVIRTRALSEAQVAEAVKLYEQGFGIQRIANQIEASYTGTRNALLRSGVTMRGRLDYQNKA